MKKYDKIKGAEKYIKRGEFQQLMKNKIPFISIVIPIKDQEKTIKTCIDSLLNLNYPEYEIIIIDNGSKDNSRDIVKEYKNKKIKLLLEQKLGSYSARNNGIRTAKGEIIAFSDGDCVAHKDWLKFLIRHFKDKKLGGVGGKIDVYRPKNGFDVYCGKFYHLNEEYIKSSYLATANVAYTRKVLEEVGLFDEHLLSSGDVDIGWKVVRSGYKLCFEPRAIVSHMYTETIFQMFKKFFWQGKYKAILNLKYGMPYKKNRGKKYIVSIRQMVKESPLNWVFYRIMQDFSFHFGLFYGSIIWKIKRSASTSKNYETRRTKKTSTKLGRGT